MYASSSSAAISSLLCVLRGASAPLTLRAYRTSACSCHLYSNRLYSSRISKSFGIPNPDQRQSYEDFVQERIREDEKQTSKLPDALYRLKMMLKMKIFRKADDLHPELRALLDKSATQLYYSCAENTNYLSLCEEFGLPDLFMTWFKFALLHVWMVLFRLHVSMDAASYQRVQYGILSTMWADVDKRIKIMQEFSNTKHTVAEMKQAYAFHLQTFFEYDEGYLDDDRNLAAAVWRNMYVEEKFEADHVANVVRYIRATIAHLTEMDSNDILVTGMEQWKVADEIKNLHGK